MEFITIKIWKDTRRLIKTIAAEDDSSLVATLHRLATEEVKRRQNKGNDISRSDHSS